MRAELDASEGDVLLARLQRPSDIPLESLFAQKEDVARTVRLTVSGVLPRDQLGEFAVQPQQRVIPGRDVRRRGEVMRRFVSVGLCARGVLGGGGVPAARSCAAFW